MAITVGAIRAIAVETFNVKYKTSEIDSDIGLSKLLKSSVRTSSERKSSIKRENVLKSKIKLTSEA